MLRDNVLRREEAPIAVFLKPILCTISKIFWPRDQIYVFAIEFRIVLKFGVKTLEQFNLTDETVNHNVGPVAAELDFLFDVLEDDDRMKD